MSKYIYINNKKCRDGLWEHYNSNGNLFWSGTYTKGKMNGFWEGFYKNGNPKYKMKYNMDRAISLRENYFANGELFEINYYL